MLEVGVAQKLDVSKSPIKRRASLLLYLAGWSTVKPGPTGVALPAHTARLCKSTISGSFAQRHTFLHLISDGFIFPAMYNQN